MKTKHAVVATALALLGTAFTLTTGRADALPIQTGGGDYPFYKEKASFGAGLSAGAHYRAFDYHEVCDALPSPKDAEKQCRAELDKIAGLDAEVKKALTMACTKMTDAQRGTYCGKDGKYLEASAEATVTAKLFGAKADILGIEGHAKGDSTYAGAGFSISVVGKKMTGIERQARLEQTFQYVFPLFRASAAFGLGPLCVSVGADAIGTFGVTIGAQAGTAGAAFDGAPFSSADVTVTASVGKWLAEVGVEGSVNLLDLRVPSSVAVTLDRSTVRWKGTSDLTFNALSGDVVLYGSLAGNRVGEIELFSWNGIPEKRYPIFSDGGTFQL